MHNDGVVGVRNKAVTLVGIEMGVEVSFAKKENRDKVDRRSGHIESVVKHK